MEGYVGKPPSSIIPFFWSPGWNSAQAINKYQIEVGGSLHDGDPGKRLIEAADTEGRYFEAVPEAWTKKEGSWCLLPCHHIFGSEETSALSPAIRERSPAPYIALNPKDAAAANIKEGDKLQVGLPDNTKEWPVRLMPSLAPGTACLPYGLLNMPYWEGLPAVDIRKVEE